MGDFFVIINVFKITLALRCSQLLLYLPSLSREDSVSFRISLPSMIKGSPLNGMGKLPRCCCHIGWAIAQKCNMNNKERKKNEIRTLRMHDFHPLEKLVFFKKRRGETCSRGLNQVLRCDCSTL